MDRLLEVYNNFYEWYIGVWYDIFGEDGMNIIQGIMGLFFVIACFMGVYLVVDKIESYY